MTSALLSASCWRQWMALLPQERAMLLPCLWLLIQARFTPARTKFDPAPALAEPAPLQDPRHIHAQRPCAHYVARLVAYAAAFCPVNMAHVHRSLVLWQLLGRKGSLRSLRVGVRNGTTQAFTTHAWVECHGEPLHEAADVYEQVGVFSRVVVSVGVSGQPLDKPAFEAL